MNRPHPDEEEAEESLQSSSSSNESSQSSRRKRLAIVALVALAAISALLLDRGFSFRTLPFGSWTADDGDVSADDDYEETAPSLKTVKMGVTKVEDPQKFIDEQTRLDKEHERGKYANASKEDEDKARVERPETSTDDGDEEERPPISVFTEPSANDNDDDDDEDFEPAPRTHHGAYNEIDPKEKYFIYSPSGGFNNQREELVNAIEIARLLNRTLYVPMAARHTDFYSTYEHLRGPRDLFSMDRILDFPHIESYGVRLVPLNITITHMVAKFIKQMGDSRVHIIYHPDAPSEVERWHRAEVLALRSIKKSLLFIRGRGFYHHWFNPLILNTVRKHTRYSHYLRQLAMRIVNETFGSEFYAMHVRLGDYRGRFSSVSAFTGGLVKTGRSRGWKPHKYPLYVATDDLRKSREDFAPIYNAFSKVVFADDIPRILVKEFRNLFPRNSQMVNDMMGILEQLICVQALDFVGTSFSTFSEWITIMRALRKYTFPELGAVKPPPADVGEDNSDADG